MFNARHNMHTHGKIGIKSICEISHDDIELLIWRTGIQKNMLNTVCLHHLKEYLDKFTTLNPFCCDPFEYHADKKISEVNYNIVCNFGKVKHCTVELSH